MMNTFLTKLAMLIFFLLAVTCAWSAVTMVFSVSLWNILLGILAAFFLLRAFELADKVNKYGPYADPEELKQLDTPPIPHGQEEEEEEETPPAEEE